MLGLILLLQTLTIAVSGPPTSSEYLPLRVAEAEGYFARQGLSVVLRTTRAEVGAAEALAQGQVDLAATSLEAALRFGSRPTVPVPRLVFGLTAAPPVVLLASKQGGEGLSVARLAGSKVGLAAPGVAEHTWLLGILEFARVSPAQVQFVSLGSRGLEAALESGEVHAGMVAEPAATRLLDGGRVVMLADLRSPEGVGRAVGGPTVSAGVFVRGDGKVSDADLTAFARALLAARERIRTTPPAELARSLPPAVVGLPVEFETRLVATREGYLPQGLVTPDQMRRTIGLIRDHQPLPATLKLPGPEEMLRLGPLRQAIQ
jgi:ABC-type nitrate/sulfonate/bicarbonate transport system substrate-binding protein